MIRADALVIGGGPAGATIAARLALAGRSVVLVEKSRYPRRKVCGEFLSASTWPLLVQMGVGAELAREAGPAVTRVGLFAREVVAAAAMPAPKTGERWGRAVGRHRLDTLLLERARAAGAAVRQPATVLGRSGDAIAIEENGRRLEINSDLVIDAHGAWERSPLGERRHEPRRDDLLAFKARFLDAPLATGLMPLVLFPGGYGGLVHTDGGAVSLSCCIRRDTLRQAREGQRSAGEAVLAHITRHCRGVREALAGARLEGPWLAAGPIRPGIRNIHDPLPGSPPSGREAFVFRVGNAAGEAHPLIAEGLSMAIQSSWLLAEALAAHDDAREAARAYAAAWRRHLAFRVRASNAFAVLTMHPATAGLAIAVLRSAPPLLTLGARWSGKAHRLVARQAAP